MNDTIVIRYQIELVVSSGGALSRSTSKPPPPQVHVPPPNLGLDLASLLQSAVGTDVQFDVEGEEMAAHKIILQVGPDASRRRAVQGCAARPRQPCGVAGEGLHGGRAAGRAAGACSAQRVWRVYRPHGEACVACGPAALGPSPLAAPASRRPRFTLPRRRARRCSARC